jgi:hypothetical protein
LRPPSRLLTSVFVDDEVKSFKKPVLQLQRNFWDVLQNLAPPEPDTKKGK